MKSDYLSHEKNYLSPHAAPSDGEGGRRIFPDKDCSIRTEFQRDRDRITHSKAFRRLMHKMQVFLAPEGDHYRTRLTHTLEVTQIARTISRALGLNEDLTEAAALGHDLGHTPFGHSGERALEILCPGGFRHAEQSIRVVDILELRPGAPNRGLNLTSAVRDAILHHSGDITGGASTAEGQIVQIADKVAYINHDIDDAIRAGILCCDDIPQDICESLGTTHSARISSLVGAVIAHGLPQGKAGIRNHEREKLLSLRAFMFERVYESKIAKSEDGKVVNMLSFLYDYYTANTHAMPEEYKSLLGEFSADTVICDYIAGMTDRYAIHCFQELYVPKVWQYKK